MGLFPFEEMAKSYTRVSGDGVTTDFTAPAYLSKDHISVLVNDLSVSFTWVSTSTVRITPAPASGADVWVRRATPSSFLLEVLSDGTVDAAAARNTVSTQLLFIEQELLEWRGIEGPEGPAGPSGDEVNFLSRDAAALASVAPTTKFIRTAGWEDAGDGGAALYRRVGVAPTHDLKFQNADGVWWELVQAQDARAAGAIADGSFSITTGTRAGTDMAPAVQAFWDAYRHFGTPAEAKIGPGVHRLLSGINVGYGTGFGGGVFAGSGRSFNGGSTASGYPGTAFLCDFTRQPGISVQGGRGVRLRDFSVWGFLYPHIASNSLGTYTPAIDDTVLENWVDAALYPNGLALKAPDCGIAFDPRSGPAPDPAYTDPAYPAFLGAVSSYNKGFTSDAEIENVEVVGLPVGIALGSFTNAGNGDFITLRKGLVTCCAVGLAISQHQSRNVVIYDWNFSNCHTAITNRMFGLGLGNFRGTKNCHYGTGIQVHDLTDTAYGPVVFDGDYAETLWRLGDIAQGGSVGKGVEYRNCDFQFLHQYWNGGELRARGIPATLLNNTGGQPLRLAFEGGKFSLGGVAHIRTTVTGVVIDGLRIELITEAHTKTSRLFYNGLAGGLVFRYLGRLERPNERINPFYLFSDIDADADYVNTQCLPGFRSKRQVCTPLWAVSHVPYNDAVADPVRLPLRVGAVSGASLVSPTLTGRVFTFDWPGLTDATAMKTGGNPGDVILHDAADNSVFMITARDGESITAQMMTNVRPDGEGDYEPITVPDLTAGTYYTASLRYYSPSKTLYGTFTATSAVISSAGTSSGDASWIDEIQVGDYIHLDSALAALTSYQKVTAVDKTAKTITLDGAASASGRVRVGTLIRTSP